MENKCVQAHLSALDGSLVQVTVLWVGLFRFVLFQYAILHTVNVINDVGKPDNPQKNPRGIGEKNTSNKQFTCRPRRKSNPGHSDERPTPVLTGRPLLPPTWLLKVNYSLCIEGVVLRLSNMPFVFFVFARLCKNELNNSNKIELSQMPLETLEIAFPRV